MVYFAYLICFFWYVKRFQSNTVTCSIQYAFFTSSVVQINQSGVPILEIGKLRTYQKKKKRKKKKEWLNYEIRILVATWSELHRVSSPKLNFTWPHFGLSDQFSFLDE